MATTTAECCKGSACCCETKKVEEKTCCSDKPKTEGTCCKTTTCCSSEPRTTCCSDKPKEECCSTTGCCSDKPKTEGTCCKTTGCCSEKPKEKECCSSGGCCSEKPKEKTCCSGTKQEQSSLVPPNTSLTSRLRQRVRTTIPTPVLNWSPSSREGVWLGLCWSVDSHPVTPQLARISAMCTPHQIRFLPLPQHSTHTASHSSSLHRLPVELNPPKSGRGSHSLGRSKRDNDAIKQIMTETIYLQGLKPKNRIAAVTLYQAQLVSANANNIHKVPAVQPGKEQIQLAMSRREEYESETEGEETEQSENEGESGEPKAEIPQLPPLGIYEGERNAEGKREGKGKNQFQNGDIYEGQYKDGVRDGIGVYEFKAAEAAIGKGAAAPKYEGEYKIGSREGKGTMTYPDGSKYEGAWLNGKREGEGAYKYANGDSYQGSWQAGARAGTATYAHADSGVKYTGEWAGGAMNGKGVLLFPDGSKYEGEFKDNLPVGKGVFSTPSGVRMVGRYDPPSQPGGKPVFVPSISSPEED